MIGIIHGSASAIGEIEKNTKLMTKAYNLGKELSS